MDYETFIDHLDHHGPDLQRWPEELRDAAGALVASSAAAAAALTRAERLDTLLRSLPDRPAPLHLADRIAVVATTSADRWQRVGDWFTGTLWRPALAASLPLVLGFALGFSLRAPPIADDVYLVEAMGLLPFSSSFEEPPYEE